MNRRYFFAKLAVAQAAFMILPAAKTYRRTWKELICPESILIPGQYPDEFDALAYMVDRPLYEDIFKDPAFINFYAKIHEKLPLRTPRTIFGVGKTEPIPDGVL